MEEALRRIKTARLALEEGGLAYCIRQCQEAVELSLKAALRMVGWWGLILQSGMT